MTTFTEKARPAALARTWARAAKLTDRVDRADMLVLGLAAGITAFGPGIGIALAFVAPYLLVQLGLWMLFRNRAK